jgi:flavin reductase (DIM6/NTAB) family NADH-FMN oxidoreductase RutF
VTSRRGDKLNGQIADTVFQITSESSTIAISINKKNLTWEYIKESGVFAVSVLCQDAPLSFIGQFGFKSGRDVDKLSGINCKLGQTRAPVVLDNATSYLEAKVTKEMDVGTHTIFVGEIVDGDVLSVASVSAASHGTVGLIDVDGQAVGKQYGIPKDNPSYTAHPHSPRSMPTGSGTRPLPPSTTT